MTRGHPFRIESRLGTVLPYANTRRHAMKATTKATKATPSFAAPEAKDSEKKWGKAVMALGYCIFPSILLQCQGRLQLNAQEMIVLLQLAEHWWTAEGQVYPSKETIGERIGLSGKQVQRHIKKLEDAGFVQRQARYRQGRGQMSNEYDLSGLVIKLKALAPEIAKGRELKAAATKPGGLVAALSKGKSDTKTKTRE